MNKKLLFLLIVISGSSMSLFGMENESDEKKETSDIYTSDYISWEHHEDSSDEKPNNKNRKLNNPNKNIVPPEQNNSSKAETPKQKIIIVGDDVFFGEGKPDSLWIKHINEEYQRNIPKTALVNYDVVEDERNINWQSERKKRLEELNKKSEKEQKEKIFEKHDVCIMDGNPYFRPKGKESWISLKLFPETHVEFEFNEQQMRKKIDIDGVIFIDGKRYFHYKDKEYWFSEDLSNQICDSDFDKQINKNQIAEKQKKEDPIELLKLESFNQNNTKPQKNDKDLTKKKQLQQQQPNVQKKEKFNKEIIKFPKRLSPIELEKCQTFNSVTVKSDESENSGKYAATLEKKLNDAKVQKNEKDLHKRDQKSLILDDAQNSKKRWVFFNPEKQKNQNELDTAVADNEIPLKDLENSKLALVKDPDKKTYMVVREKPESNPELKVLDVDNAKPQEQNLDAKTNSKKPWIFRNPDIQVYENAGSAWQENSDDKELWTIIGKGSNNKQESLELQPLDSIINIDDTKPLEQNIDTLSLHGHGSKEIDPLENDPFWNYFKKLENEKNQNSNQNKSPYNYHNPEIEKDLKRYMQQPIEEWKIESEKKEKEEKAKKKREAARQARLKEIKELRYNGFKKGIEAYATHQVFTQKPVPDAFHQGAIAGIEQGTATAVGGLIVMAAQAVIEKGVEWWNQPSSEQLAQLEEKMQVQQFIKALDNGIEKRQKFLESNSRVLTTVANTTEKAQQIFEKQLEQQKQQFISDFNNNHELKMAIHTQVEIQKQKELAQFDEKLAQERKQKIKDLKNQSNQSKPLHVLIQKLDNDISQKKLLHERELEVKYALEKQEELFIQKSLAELDQESPDSEFSELHKQYLRIARGTFQEFLSQQAMMNQLVAGLLQNQHSSPEITVEDFDMIHPKKTRQPKRKNSNFGR